MEFTWKHLHASVVQLYEQSLEAGAADAALAQAVALQARGEPLPAEMTPHGALIRQLTWLLFGRLAEVDPPASVAIKLAVSTAAAGAGSLQEAIQLAWTCEEAEHERVAEWPVADRADHFYNRAVAFGGRGDLLSAAADATSALEANPDDVQALMNRGTWFMQLQDVQSAMDDWGRAVEVQPGYALGWLKLGAVKLSYGVPEGRADVQRALDCAPEGWEHRAQAEAWLAEG
ncbi:MAG: hypothetical protein H6741_24565 [Alphaproteobacteria bacterium]|nr:hypothetical protein [Alphaproteobacteria bacterium]